MDANARKALFLNLSKSLIDKEQIKTTLERAKAIRRVVEKLVTRAKTDTLSNRRLVASELRNDAEAIKKLFTVLGPRYKERAGGYTRVLKAGMRYGDAADMAMIEFVDRDVSAKKKLVDNKEQVVEKNQLKKSDKPEKAVKIKKESDAHVHAAKGVKEVAVKRRATGK